MPHTPEHVLEESTRVAQEAAASIGKEFEQGIGVIDSTVLTEQPDLATQITEPKPVPAFPVESLDATVPEPLQPTVPEQEVSDFSTRLQALNQQLVGQSAFRAEQEEEQGLSALTATQRDLSAQLQSIQAEAKAIPLRVEGESEGRGRTLRNVRAITIQQQRENAITALTIGAKLAGARGDVAQALELIDRAVAQRFQPIREEIAATRANLDLILESPQFSLADKNRARKADAQQAKRERELDKEEANDRQIGQIGVDVATRGGDAILLRRIQEATDPIEAQRIATSAGFGIQPELNTFEQRTDPQGNLIEVELTPQGQVISTRIITAKAGAPGDVEGVLDAAQQRTLDQATTAITNIDNVINILDTGGILVKGAISRVAQSIIPGTDSFDLDRSLDTIKALIGFDALQKMRDASPTGGALGQVSEKEINFLQSVSGSLSIGQSTEQFRETLILIRASFLKVQFIIDSKVDGHSDKEIQDFLKTHSFN